MAPVSGEPPYGPELALDYLAALSTDIRAAVLLDGTGSLVAHNLEDGLPAERVGELVVELFRRADDAAPPETGEVSQVEVTAPSGGIYAVRRPHWLLAVIAGRFALSSLMFYDLRSVLSDLEEKAA